MTLVVGGLLRSEGLSLKYDCEIEAECADVED